MCTLLNTVHVLWIWPADATCVLTVPVSSLHRRLNRRSNTAGLTGVEGEDGDLGNGRGGEAAGKASGPGSARQLWDHWTVEETQLYGQDNVEAALAL